MSQKYLFQTKLFNIKDFLIILTKSITRKISPKLVNVSVNNASRQTHYNINTFTENEQIKVPQN